MVLNWQSMSNLVFNHWKTETPFRQNFRGLVVQGPRAGAEMEQELVRIVLCVSPLITPLCVEDLSMHIFLIHTILY